MAGFRGFTCELTVRNAGQRTRTSINIATMVSVLRRIMEYEMTIAEWIGIAVLVGIPHVALGIVWTVLQPQHLAGVDGFQKAAALVGGIVFWPVLLVATVCSA